MKPFARRSQQPGQAGFTIIEALLAIAVLAVIAQAFAFFLRNALRSSLADRDKAFATEKAVEMMEELRGLVLDGSVDIKLLNAFDDGRQADAAQTPLFKYTLTTKREVTHPGGNTVPDASTGGHPLSDNPLRGSGFAFVRHVDIASGAPLDPNVRKIHVRVYKAAPNLGASATAPAAAQDPHAVPLAEVYGVVHSLGSVNPPRQVMDLYLIALESVPGWWSRTSNLIPIMGSSISSVQARNPGLKIRAHWIKRLSYGRDLEYVPEVNRAVRADSGGAFKKAYVYPGLVRFDDPSDDYYYFPEHFSARVNLDGVLAENDGYAVADQFNHAMRLPDEERLYAIHRQVAVNNGAPAPELSLRLLLQRLSDNDPQVRNSIIINLHGELLPLVPLRNVSDGAKDPARYWSGRTPSRAWRVASHPERLRFDAATQVPAVRVYAWDMNGTSYPDTITAGVEDDIIDLVTLFVPDASLSNLKSIARMQGNSRSTYAWKAYSSSNWQSGGGKLSDSAFPIQGSATWVAEDYTTPKGRSGLRIRLFGVTPTARVRYGPYLP